MPSSVSRNGAIISMVNILSFSILFHLLMFTRENLIQLQSTRELETLDWSDFEWFSKYFFEHLGYERAHVTGKHGEFDGDGGIDVEMYKDNEKIYVQCKRWNVGFNGRILPLHVIRELGGCLLRDGVKKGVVITTLDLDDSGKKEAKLMNIDLYGLAEITQNMKLINPKFDLETKEKKIGFWHRVLWLIVRLFKFFFRD